MTRNEEKHRPTKNPASRSHRVLHATWLATVLGFGTTMGCGAKLDDAAGESQHTIVAPLAFPGAEGFGRGTPGGRGGAVLTVTNLNANGPGSLAWAVGQSGPRIIVFNVEGRIRLTDPIQIREPYVTIAGQTAPGQGVVISGARLRVTTHDVVIRGMKFRVGDESNGDTPRNRDNLALGTGAENVVIDSNSMTWGVDENVSLWGTVHNVTISNNLIAEALHDSIHIDEGRTSPRPHSMGLLVGGSDSSASDEISIIKNLLASNEFRNPYLKSVRKAEVYNNYVHNYGAAHQGLKLGGNDAPVTAAVVGNYFEDGHDTGGDPRPPFDFRSMSGGKIYLDDNEQTGHAQDSFHGGASFVVSSRPFNASNTALLDSDEVSAHVSAHAGARVNGQLDPVDGAVMNRIATGQSRVIDAISEVGGYTLYTFSDSTYVDDDDDGMPNWFEQQYGFNPSVDDSAGDSDGDGYTNIEEYINGRLTGTYHLETDAPPPPPTGNTFYIEAEDMALSGFAPKSNGVASGGAWIQTSESGTASYEFAGPSGVYDLEIFYFDESDGVSQMQVMVNGSVIDSWSWDDNLGSHLANAQTRTSRLIASANLNVGDVVELVGSADGREPLRTDAIGFTAAGPSTPPPATLPVFLEAEDMTLEGFAIVDNGSASAGRWIQTKGAGTASYEFDGAAGLYDLRIHYYDETDGVSHMEIQINGVSRAQWDWSSNLGSHLANEATRTSLDVVGIALQPGDTVTLMGHADGEEPLRTDLIEFLPPGS